MQYERPNTLPQAFIDGIVKPETKENEMKEAD